ncbi:YfhO family protein [Sphingobacterium suaedae]|uniref:YfhO family protein n=1 Tax=Sphingobacterium suaedae TaxID=1686402 RepID=A0ABW5KQZ1_9SPHI
MKQWFKENSTHLIIIAIFIVLVFFYFSPIFGGKTLAQSDVMQAEGSQKELFDYRAKDGHAPLWTNSMFGGMPTYQIWYEHASNVTSYLNRAIRAVFPVPTDIVLLYLLGGYFLFSVLRLKPWLSAVGAIALAFTSYNFIYIEAGHVNKAYAIAYLAPIIGSVLLCYRGSRLWGPILLALFLAMEIRTNHVQITYYLFIALLLYVGVELYYAIRDKKLKNFLQASALQVGAALIAVMVNASVLFPTLEYSKLTTRGTANIQKVEDGQKKSSGLDKTYAYEWSQGVGENITFLIPNAYGGRNTGPVLDAKSEIVKFFTKNGVPETQAVEFSKRIPTYWGEKMITSGPWYFGAGIFFLFVLGLIIVKGRIKWWVLGATTLCLFLAFGKHFPLISDLFFDYFPMYNKFRAVESILVIPAILIPLLAILAVDSLLNRASEIPKLDKKVLYTFVGVGGFCLLVGLMPSLFLDFKNSGHQEYITSVSQQLGGESVGREFSNALIKDRSALASQDAYRSFFIIALTFGLVWFYLKKKLSIPMFLGILGVVTLADLWAVDKRYLNDDSFIEERAKTHVVEREVDQLIRLDKDPSYRVLDLTTNPFSDARASYFHKSIGGYHAAKLMRFQEVLEHQFNGAINEDVLDMLNVRYLITQNPQNGAEQIQRRSTAAGNAWFVNKVTFVKDNAQEMQAISSFDPRKEAFVHEAFKNQLNAARLGQPSNAEIKLVSYHPDTLRYESTSPNDAFAVFSEVYYEKGWKAFIDGKEVPIIRADYLLRALQVPGGNHTIEFIFAPASIRISNMISLIASIILVVGLCAALAFSLWAARKNKWRQQ